MTGTLRQLERHVRESALDSSNITWTHHSELRMRQRGISRSMALDVLRQGVVVREPEPAIAGGVNCRMERFVAGLQVAVVVNVERPQPHLVVITVIDVRRG